MIGCRAPFNASGHRQVNSLASGLSGHSAIDMSPISYRRHRFPPQIIRCAVWLYHRLSPSLREVEDFLSERKITVSCRHF